MTRFITATLLGLTLAGAASAAPPKSVTFNAKAGIVTYDHEGHAKRAGACKACHPAAPAKLAGKEAAHALCLDCHKAKQAGPVKCSDCHKKA
jgi:cytochrome c553